MREKFLKDVDLSLLTTIGLGGKADLFISCMSENDIVFALEFAKKNNLRVQVFSGGSNIIFPDEGFNGLVMKIDLKGIEFIEEENIVFVKIKAGEVWDDVVKYVIEKKLSGIECLSGIPGSAGATPVQNVGAYGQEIKDSLVSLKAIDRETLKEKIFSNEECEFGYRQSRFKNEDKDRYVITELLFGFMKEKVPEIKYQELQKFIDSNNKINSDEQLINKLSVIRNSILELRTKKSMIIDNKDPNSRSCGSFFLNPVISREDLKKFYSKTGDIEKDQIPVYSYGDTIKLSAAWLVEKAGFKKGYTYKGVGLSSNHSLALININGTSSDLIDLAAEIKSSVFEKFGIRLSIEPVIV